MECHDDSKAHADGQTQEKELCIENFLCELIREIYAPLDSILALLQVMRDRSEQRRDNEKENFDMLIAAAEKTKNMTDSIISFTKSSRDEFGLVDMADLCRKATLLLKIRAARNNIDLITQIDLNVQLVQGSNSQLLCMILNLLNNAIESMDKQEKDKTITIDLRPAKGGLQLKIIDTGCGMDEKTIARAFSLGFTTKPAKGGTGLYICENIVRMHNGEINMISSLGHGTVFSVRLPTYQG